MQYFDGNGNKYVYEAPEKKARVPWKSIIHRGHFDGYPENSIASFYKCWEAGMDGLEFDTQVTTDNVIIVVHDATITGVSATTGETVTITPQECTLAQVKDIILASADDFGDIYIPTLDEFFTFLSYHRMYVFHDRKNKGSMEEEAYFAALATSAVKHNVCELIDYRCDGYEDTVKVIDPSGGVAAKPIGTAGEDCLSYKAAGRKTYMWDGGDGQSCMPYYPDFIQFNSVEIANSGNKAYLDSQRFFDNSLTE